MPLDSLQMPESVPGSRDDGEDASSKLAKFGGGKSVIRMVRCNTYTQEMHWHIEKGIPTSYIDTS